MYMHAVQKEAECCKSGEVVDMEYHHDVRQGSSTALACFAPFEPVLSIDLPNEVVEHSVFEEILVIDIVTNWHFSRSFHFYFSALTLVVIVQSLAQTQTYIP